MTAEPPAEPEPEATPVVCVWCGEAVLIGGRWIITAATPPCDHETIDGRR